MTTAKPTTDKLAIDGGTPVRTEPFGPQWIFGDEEKQLLLEVIDHAKTSRTQPKVAQFADAFATMHGVKYAVPTNNGTNAVHACVAAIDPNPGDEIITTPVSDIGTLSGILFQNAVPIFADWVPGTFNTDPADIERKITPRTRAILIVHLYGNPGDLDGIMAVARRHRLPVIEDCSQAHLAEYQGRKVGTIGDIAAFSLGGKTLTTIQGGMVISDNFELARRAMGASRKGAEFPSAFRSSLAPDPDVPNASATMTTDGTTTRPKPSQYAFLGESHAMTDLHAAIGLAQIRHWEENTAKKCRAAKIIGETVAELPGIAPQKVRPGDRHVYWVYGYLVDEEVLGVTAAQFSAALRAEGIADAYGPYIDGKPLHRYPIFAEERTYGTSRFPFVDDHGRRRVDYASLRLPVIDRELPRTGGIALRNSVTEQDARDMAAALKKVALHYAARRQPATTR